MKKTKNVMLIIETSKSYGRALLDGIGRYAMTHGRWSLYVEERGLSDRQPTWLADWKGNGIIFRSNSQAMVQAISGTGLPSVDTHSHIIDHGFPLVYPDERGTAKLAAEHFLDRGFKHFGFCAIERDRWVDWREEPFVGYLAKRNLTCHRLILQTGRKQKGWVHQFQQMIDWVKQLPKPIAVLAANDVCGMRLLDACRIADIAVPEQIAVLGVDDDKTLCNLTTPPLSSIDLNIERIGYEAASLLDRMMRRRYQPKRSRLIQPAGVVARQSTNILAVDDPLVAEALRFIREHACQNICVTDLIRALGVSRRALEIRFQHSLNRSPKQQIMRMQMQRSKALLRETDLSITKIAGQMGFTSFNYFSSVFKREVGITPLAYRRQYKT